MRSAASTTLARGRHRWGRPGLVHVAAFVTVRRRSLFASWRTPGRHHRRLVRRVSGPVPEPLPAL